MSETALSPRLYSSCTFASASVCTGIATPTRSVLSWGRGTVKYFQVPQNEIGHIICILEVRRRQCGCWCLQIEEKRIFESARSSGKYNHNAYLMENSEEFWAEASQAWFEATLREDVTSGLRTKQQILEREPELAQLMLRVYGETDWLYCESSTRQLYCKTGGRRPPQKVQKVPVSRIKEQLGVLSLIHISEPTRPY